MTSSAPHPEHILVVDDDPRIRQMLARYFEGESYRVTAVADGRSMREALQQRTIDAVLLDLVLGGGEDGLELAREIRGRSDVPIIMLTGRDDVVDRIVGLEIGADDYIAKPFHLREVLARLRTILRRRKPKPASETETRGADTLHFDGWRLDLGRRELHDAGGSPIELTTGEFDLLTVLARQPGHVFTRETLMDLTRGRSQEAFDRTIDAQISRLRKKIEKDPANPKLVKSVRGVGYVFTGRESV
jgi:two-component system phosphate regulon response regulator OmpR